MHDLGLIAAKRTNPETGREEFGFEMYVGGGLGAVPYQAKLFDAFVAPEELLPRAQAIARVFARHGEKKNRNRARIKFLIQDLGIEVQTTGARRTQDSPVRSALDRIHKGSTGGISGVGAETRRGTAVAGCD